MRSMQTKHFSSKGTFKQLKAFLKSLAPDGVLSCWSVPILQPSAKQSIELSNDMPAIPCNVLDILPVYVYTSTILFLA
jgi:hypothetical protein